MLEIYTKLKKRVALELVFLVMKIKNTVRFMYHKNVVKKNMLIYY